MACKTSAMSIEKPFEITAPASLFARSFAPVWLDRKNENNLKQTWLSPNILCGLSQFASFKECSESVRKYTFLSVCVSSHIIHSHSTFSVWKQTTIFMHCSTFNLGCKNPQALHMSHKRTMVFGPISLAKFAVSQIWCKPNWTFL
jgi:hypothetical protein